MATSPAAVAPDPSDIQWDDTPAPAPAAPAAAPASAAAAVPVADAGTPSASPAPDANAVQWDQAPQAQSPAAVPEGFTPPEREQLIAYVPKAKDANDLEQFSLTLTNGRAKIGNPQEVIDAYTKGQRTFGFAAPHVDQTMAPQKPQSGIKDVIGDAILDSIDQVLPGVGTFLRNHRDEGRAFTANAADAVGGDYGPEIAGFLDTATDPSQFGDFGANLDRNVAQERAALSSESEDHPIASAAGQLTGAALTAPLAGEALDAADIAASGSKIASAGRAAAGGAVYGSGAAGPGNRLVGAVTGAGLGAATDVALPYVPVAIKALKSLKSAAPELSPEAEAAAQSASDLGITLPDFALTDKGRAAAGAVEAKPFGFPIRQAANEMVDTSKAARDAAAAAVGSPAETDAQLGEQTLDAAVRSNKNRRAAIGDLYDYAKTMSAGTDVAPTQTLQTLDSILADEDTKIGGSKIAPVLQAFRDDLNDAGSITVQQARDMRTSLREQLTNEAGATPSNADRLTNQVMSAVNADMKDSLPGDAYDTYKAADAAWAQQRGLEDDVLKPFLGKDFGNEGEVVAQKINTAAKGYGTRLARFLSSLPDDEANNVRATLIQHLGSSTPGQQNAANDAFSLSTFLTNWSKMSGARKLIFAPDTVASLDKLANVAQVAKASEKFVNRSNTGRVMSSAMLSGPADAGIIGAFFSGEPKYAVVGLLGSAFGAIRQYGSAKMLANPSIVKKIAATPMNMKAAQAFWSRPWVKGLQLQNPAIAGEIQAFQQAILSGANDNVIRQVPKAASGPDSQQDTGNQQP